MREDGRMLIEKEVQLFPPGGTFKCQPPSTREPAAPPPESRRRRVPARCVCHPSSRTPGVTAPVPRPHVTLPHGEAACPDPGHSLPAWADRPGAGRSRGEGDGVAVRRRWSPGVMSRSADAGAAGGGPGPPGEGASPRTCLSPSPVRRSEKPSNRPLLVLCQRSPQTRHANHVRNFRLPQSHARKAGRSGGGRFTQRMLRQCYYLTKRLA